jgi:RNA polymerase sigma factor (sigma-70 family)
VKIIEPEAALRQAATQGDLAALNRLLATVQPGVYNLAVRMLGNRDDAADATQEILLKLVTHLASFRGDAAFSTWVWRIARNHLLTTSTRSAESPEVSLEGMAERLQVGMDFADTLAQRQGAPAQLTPQDKLEARQLALGCTQSMLMTLNREQRLAYVLDSVFGLPSKDAAAVVGITPDAYRQRLSRARALLDNFTDKTCGLANPQARCHCEAQLPAWRNLRANAPHKPASLMAIHRNEMGQVEQAFAAFTRVGDAAALFRAHPNYQAPQAMLAAIRAVLTQEGFLDTGPLQ